MNLCKKCNSPIDEKEDKTIFYCDECLIDVGMAFNKIKEMLK